MEPEEDTSTEKLGDNNSRSSETLTTSSGSEQHSIGKGSNSSWQWLQCMESDPKKEIEKYTNSLQSFGGKYVIQWRMHFSF